MKKDKFENLAVYFVIVVILVTTSVVGFYLVNKFKKEQLSEIIPSEYPDYDAIKSDDPDPDIKRALITEDCPKKGCKSDRPATQELDAIEKRYKIKERFARVYLYAEVIVDYKRPLTAWDSIYFKMGDFGGHLIKDENLLPVPPGDTSIYLYDLRSVSYYPTIQDKENRENRVNNFSLFNLLQDTAVFNIMVFISSDRPGRIMKEVSIYYECYENYDCGIEEIE